MIMFLFLVIFFISAILFYSIFVTDLEDISFRLLRTVSTGPNKLFDFGMLVIQNIIDFFFVKLTSVNY